MPPQQARSQFMRTKKITLALEEELKSSLAFAIVKLQLNQRLSR